MDVHDSTACDAYSCPANSIGASIEAGCVCESGYIGTITASTRIPFYNGNCAQCGPGKYQPNVNQTICISCEPGSRTMSTYQRLVGVLVRNFEMYTYMGSTACIACEAGRYNFDSSSPKCEKCNAGMYQIQSGGTMCDVCMAGKSQPLAGQVHCDECNAGTYSSTVAAIECAQCDAGTYQSDLGKTGCHDCTAGQFQHSKGQRDCNGCSPGTYSSSRAVLCTSCPGFEEDRLSVVSAEQSKSPDECRCSSGYFSNGYGSSCSKCAVGLYKSRSGVGSCEACPADSVGCAGATSCQCKADYSMQNSNGYPVCVPGPANCTGSWGMCSEACIRLFAVATPATGGGVRLSSRCLLFGSST